MTPRLRRLLPLACVALGVALYAAALTRLSTVRRVSVTQELQVALPVLVQVVAAGGDRFLAANVDVWRSLVAATERMQAENFRVQGELQVDASWLNPRHEDNYWVAAAILPWNGQFAAGQKVLQRAALTRRYDWKPQFYYAFGIYFFQRDATTAAAWLRQAAPYLAAETDRYQLEGMAAHWYERRYKPEEAVRVLREMAKNSRSSGFRVFLEKRAERVQILIDLRAAIQRYTEKFGHAPKLLGDLVDAGIIADIPQDPFGQQNYVLEPGGQPALH